MTFNCMDRMLSNNEASSISIPNSLITVPKKVKAKSQQNLSTSDRLNTLLYHIRTSKFGPIFKSLQNINRVLKLKVYNAYIQFVILKDKTEKLTFKTGAISPSLQRILVHPDCKIKAKANQQCCLFSVAQLYP